MATKCITITIGAYERLSALKEPSDSFSDVITKLTGRYSLLDLAGTLSKEESSELKGNIKDLRERLGKRMENAALRLR